MMIGSIVIIDRQFYFVTNASGSLEKLPRLKWFAELYLEVIQGIGRPLPVARIREFVKKYKIPMKGITS